MWERWQAMAASSGLSVTALIVRSVDGSPGALAEVASLRDEVERLKRELAAAQAKPVASVAVESGLTFPVRAVGSLLKGGKPKKGGNHAHSSVGRFDD